MRISDWSSDVCSSDLMDKLGITAHIYRVGTFKSAVEPFLRSDQSPEAKEADLAYAGALWENWLTDVKKARPAAKIDAFIADTAGAVKAAGNDQNGRASCRERVCQYV